VTEGAIRVGAFAPLTCPGLVPAGRRLRAGLELGVEDVNRAEGVDGRFIELILRDTAGEAGRRRDRQPSSSAIATAVAGQATVNSTERRTVAGISARSTVTKPKRAKKAVAVSVRR
jgi:ABC-type branched-subunit amino acid transport system substrate-binding protein